MQLGHIHRRHVQVLPATSRAQRDRGFVLVMFALLLVPLLLMVGLAVDVGSWYNRGSDIQKAADAASLAGVVWLPNEAKAVAAALDTAKKNGFDDNDPFITVEVKPSLKSPNRLRVTISDERVGSFFYKNIGGSDINMARTSFSEYVLPVRMGSPLSSLGNDPTMPGVPSPNLWASISGPDAAYANGDPYSTKNAGIEYRDWGYVYVIDVPKAAEGQTLTMSVYDAGQYPRSDYPNVETADNGTVNTQFEFFKPDDTPLNPLDGLLGANRAVNTMSGKCLSGTPGIFKLKHNTDAATHKNKWADLCRVTVPLGGSGQWMMQVKTSAMDWIGDNGAGWNQFSVKASLSGANQPALYTVGDISLFNNLPGLSGNVDASFYLAQIDEIHAGKTLEVSLFDPGDGQSGDYYANIRAPGNVTNSCKYRARGTANWISSDMCRITTRTGGKNKYNGKWLDIQIDLAPGYTCTTDCWWKVLYEFQNVTAGNSPNDRTVWSARVIGDPVHLVEEN